MEINIPKTYELVFDEILDDANGKGFVYRHKKTGAKVTLIKNDDENKVFYIGFRTPPKDSTGVAHILEHSVLCGSEKFPSKEPFVELIKGSLNTFLNAMTYSDKTVYPVASCNDADFQNLVDVYLDAVFFPNIYKKEEIFLQEGWNYNLESSDAELKYNGVVYNEMKGVFSSPEQELIRTIQNSLFPDTTYGVESGGDPENIIDLSYEEFLDFHREYYHPSNSYIYLYGDMDFEEKLDWIDKEYLSKFDKKEIDSEIQMQKPFDQPVQEIKAYAISDHEEMKDNTYLSRNVVIGDGLNNQLNLSIQIIEYALLSAPGAPVKQKLIDKGIGKDILSSYQDGILQPTFSIIAKNANEEDINEFLKIIEEELESIVENGIERDSLKAAINYFEFRYLEADYGSYPRGLIYGLQVASSWIYDENKPFLSLHDSKVYEVLKSKIDTGYFEGLIKEYLLGNNHSSTIILKPEKGLGEKKEEAIKEKLRNYKESLSEEETNELVHRTKTLKAYQEEEDKKEDIEKIPLLAREDISKKSQPFYNEEYSLEGAKLVHHNIHTNGIAYIRLMFNANGIPQVLVPYTSLLSRMLGMIDTKNYSYLQLSNKINIETGGIGTSLRSFAIKNDVDQFITSFGVSSKVFYNKIPMALELIDEIIHNSIFNDDKRLEEILNEIKSEMEMQFNSSGHVVAISRARSYYSNHGVFKEKTEGIDFYYFIKELSDNFQEKKEEAKKYFKDLLNIIFTKDRLLISLTSDKEGLRLFKEAASKSINSLNKTDLDLLKKYDHKEAKPIKLNEGLKTSSQVQYVARVGNFLTKGLEYTGALRVLNVILSYDYLWNNIRVKGGAYGCMSGFSALDGEGYFVSYRDPNLLETNEVYEKAAEYIRNFEADERDITKYIIGTMSNVDRPLTPQSQGRRSLNIYFSGITMEDIEREREEILNVTQEDIQALGDIVEAIMEDDYICVLGNDKKIEENKDIFMEVKNLL